MSTVKIRIAVTIEIQTQRTIYDTESGMVNNWSAIALFQGKQIERTTFGETFKTEKSAITALKKLLKNY